MSDQMPPFTQQQPSVPPSFVGMPPGSGGVVKETIPWEERDTIGWADALIENVKLCLLQPSEFFRKMRREGDMNSPIFYIVILGWIGGAAGQVWQYLFGQWIAPLLDRPPQSLGLTIGMILIMPIAAVVGLFISSGIVHLSLMVVGGAKSGYESTLRVLSYSSGSVTIFQVVPILGIIVASVWGLVLEIMGLAKVNNITYPRAAVAIFLPIILCCTCLGMGAAIMIPLIMKGIGVK